MNNPRTPKQRLPAHLKHLSPASSEPKEERKSGKPARREAAEAPQDATSGATDRLSQLLPLVLQAMVGDRALTRGPVMVSQEDIAVALEPYYRPNSRFEQLMMRKLVGEGYLRPRGARDKHGLSAAYELTPKGEKLLRQQRPR